ncbi:MAG: TonB-dependent receptor, partial [Bacteroidia bacterium]
MKQILIILIFLPRIYLAQTNPTVSGKIISRESSTPIAYATVSIGRKNADNNLLNQTLSQENGIFTVSSPARGAVEISVWAVGYDSLKMDLFLGEKNDIFDVGTIVLQEKEITLDAVEIQADKSTISSDLNQKSFNLDDNISQSGGSVLDALKGYPGVTVDQEGKVYLRGSDKIMVLIDGVLTPLTGFGNQKGLDNIPASSIARIEIINNPSAKYQASGMAGVINLIPKTNLDKGWNGEVGLSLGMGQIFRRKADLPTELGSYAGNHKILPNLNLNYRNEKIRYFLNGSVLNQRKLPNNEFTTRTYNDGRVIASQVPENRTQTQYIVNTGFDWNLNSKNILSLSSILDYESHIDTAQIPYILTNTNIRNRYWHWKEDEVTGFFNVRLDYKHLFPKAGHELSIRGQYTRGWENEQYFLSDSSQYREANDRTHIIAKEHTSLFNLDYTRPLKSGRLETGAMFQLRTLPVTYEIGRGTQSVIAEGLGEWSDWGETILSAYANYLYERPKFDVEAGL